MKERDGAQLELPLSKPDRTPTPERTVRGLKVIRGEGLRVQEPLKSRDAVIRVLVETGADMLLRRISVERAEEIHENVERILELFDRVDRRPELMAQLRRELDDLEALMRETRGSRGRR